MADYTAIADVGQTLIKLLQDNMGDLITDPNHIALCSPGEIKDDSTRLSLFLYRVVENEHLKNQQERQVNSTKLQYKPLTLDLFYMMTAYSPTEGLTQKNIEEHRVLGRAMQVFYDNAILKGSVLQGGLAGADEELRIVLTTVQMENLPMMWNSFDEPYKPSVFYQITPVRIDSTRRSDVQRVIEKQMQYYQMTVRKREQ